MPPALQLLKRLDQRSIRRWDKPGQHCPEAGNRRLAGGRIGPRHTVAQLLEQRGFERGSRPGQAQQPLAAVAVADDQVDMTLLLQVGEHPTQRLLGDAEQPQQIADRHIRSPGNEVKRAMMGSPQSARAQQVIGAADHIGIAEIEQLDAAAQLGFAQEQCGSARRRRNCVSHVDVFAIGSYRRQAMLER